MTWLVLRGHDGINVSMAVSELIVSCRRVFSRVYPNMRDKPGMRVLLLLDSGPGRNSMTLMCWARARGLYTLACRTPPPYSRKLMEVTVDQDNDAKIST